MLLIPAQSEQTLLHREQNVTYIGTTEQTLLHW